MTLTAHTTDAVLSDAHFPALRDHIIAATGLMFYAECPQTLAGHVAERIEACALDGCFDYLGLLREERAGEAEWDELTANLTIGETFFFRHQELFGALERRVIPELIDCNRQSRRLRIWSAGCAIGAEPYSLAILLKRQFETQLAGWDVTIIATDINRKFLTLAQRGEFNEWALRCVPPTVKSSCFSSRRQAWQINEEYRRSVLFQYHNLVQHPFPSLVDGLSAFDLILCRNVMIYFEPSIVRRLAGQFYDALVEGGWFVVGPVEPSVDVYRAFQTINFADVTLYRKGPQAAAPAASLAPFSLNGDARDPNNSTAPKGTTTTIAKAAAEFAANNLRRPTAPCRRETPRAAASIASTLADARAQLNRGESDAAADCCQTLLDADRLNPVAHFFQALVAGQQGRLAQSQQALRHAIYLDRDYILAHYHLGLLLQRNRDFSAAQRSYRNVLALLRRRDAEEIFADADGLTVGALRQLTEMHLEVLNRT